MLKSTIEAKRLSRLKSPGGGLYIVLVNEPGIVRISDLVRAE